MRLFKDFETYVEAFCEHLRRMGLNATVESKKSKRLGDHLSEILGPVKEKGSIRVVNRNIDLVELEWLYAAESGNTQCSYVVEAKVNGLEDRLKAKLKVVTKYRSIDRIWRRELVDFKWNGRELAQVLNGDANLRDKLYAHAHMKVARERYFSLEIKPDKKHQCVRIIDRSIYGWAPVSAFPSIEAFEVYDRIAYHVRSITNVAKEVKLH